MDQGHDHRDDHQGGAAPEAAQVAFDDGPDAVHVSGSLPVVHESDAVAGVGPAARRAIGGRCNGRRRRRAWCFARKARSRRPRPCAPLPARSTVVRGPLFEEMRKTWSSALTSATSGKRFEGFEPARRNAREADFEDVLAGNGGLEFQGRIERHQLAVVHDGDAVAKLVGLVHVMRGDEDGEVALALEAGEHFPDGDARDGVEAGGGLVEEEDFWLVDQPAGDFQPPPHAAGEHFHGLVRPLGEIDGGEQFVDGAPRFSRGMP